MKYGLITIHATQNYGSLLQTYSTYKAIESLGKDVELVDYRNEAIEKREKPITEVPVKSVKDLIKRFVWGRDQKKKYDGVISFLKSNVKLSQRYTKSNIIEANSRYDAFVSGSDIVWGTNITQGDMTYFLDFADDDKIRISYASSVGTEWKNEEKKCIKPLLQKYESISVREQIAAEWIEELTGESAEITCDPTMLWDSDFWRQFTIDNYAPKRRYVLIYAVNPDNKNILDGIEYARLHNMDAYFVNFYSPVKGTKTIRPVTVQQWITLFANADTVFSASYHGLLFSLYFHRKVFFYNRGEKSRMISLSRELGIENREGIEDNVKNDAEIDFSKIDDVIKKKREKSWNYLKKVFV